MCTCGLTAIEMKWLLLLLPRNYDKLPTSLTTTTTQIQYCMLLHRSGRPFAWLSIISYDNQELHLVAVWSIVACCRYSAVLMLIVCCVVLGCDSPVWGRAPSTFPLFPLSIYFVIFCFFYFSLFFIGFTYFLLLSIPSLSTRIVPLRFQAGGCRKRPNLGLVCFGCVICIP